MTARVSGLAVRTPAAAVQAVNAMRKPATKCPRVAKVVLLIRYAGTGFLTRTSSYDEQQTALGAALLGAKASLQREPGRTDRFQVWRARSQQLVALLERHARQITTSPLQHDLKPDSCLEVQQHEARR